MIDLTCWGCGRPGRASDRLEGRMVACKECGAVILVPARPVRKPYPLGRAVAVDRLKASVATG